MPRIVVIGAGPGGLNFVQAFGSKLKASDEVELVWLEQQTHYYHCIASPRAFVNASFTSKLFVPLDRAIPKAAQLSVKLVRGKATAISGETKEISYVAIDNATNQPTGDPVTLKYDFLIVATGSSYPWPIKEDLDNLSRAATEEQFQLIRDKVDKAQKILIIGGGAVACEVAGEIAVKYPEKSVTILEGRSELVAGNDLKPKFRAKLAQALEKLKVKVILNEKLLEKPSTHGLERKTLKTDKGTEIESDVQLLCAGYKPNSQLIQQMDASAVDERGSIKVNGHFELAKDPSYNIFVLGDANNHPTPKLGFWAGEQARFLANEMIGLLRKEKSDEKITKEFPKVKVEAMILPLGPTGGVSQLPVMGGTVVGDFVTRNVKAKDMFVGMIWGQLGSTPPAE